MAKKGKKKNKKQEIETTVDRNGTRDASLGQIAKMKNKEYETEIFKLQVELVKLQEWVKKTGARIVIVFEGRDAAGKGGIIKRIMERVSPRVFRLVALPAATDRQKLSSMPSVTWNKCQRAERSSFLIVAGTTGLGLST